MKSETLKRDLCTRLMDGVKVKDEDGNIGILTSISTNSSYECVEIVCNEEIDMLHIEEIKPILFPTSALTKPIRLANYNNGEPFVPVEELKRIGIYDHIDFISVEAYGLIRDRGLNGWFGEIPFKITELLHKWHINYRLSPDQFIEVTDENNPYI